MGRYHYLTSKEMYDKLKKLLSLDIKFSSNIKSSYFCIYGKSKIIGIKQGTSWYVNLDNWGVTDKELLPRLGINAITPGAYALKEFKASLRDVRETYNKLFPKLKPELNKVLKSGYNSGLLYAQPGFYNQPVYHYDINAAYGDAFLNTPVPVGAPEIIDHFVPPDGKHLHVYLCDLNVEYVSQDIFPYLVNSSDVGRLPSQIVSDTGMSSIYKVLTEIEYQDLVNDYDVINHCWYTLRYKKKHGLFQPFVHRFFGLKQSSEKEARTIYKSVLASLAGKFAQGITQQNIPESVNEFGNIEYSTFNIPADEIFYISPGVSLFIVDYVRKKLRDTIRKVGYKNILLADTDGFISLTPIDLPLNSDLGGWKKKIYQNIIVNGKRSYFYTENGEFHSSISGLGDIYDEQLNDYTYEDIEQIYKLKNVIPVMKKVMYQGEEKYISMNVHIGEKV